MPQVSLPRDVIITEMTLNVGAFEALNENEMMLCDAGCFVSALSMCD